ncbi:MAG TPA: glycosyltransferase family 4 protein [Candidatus Corynebacterium gallistercoris]|uniref:Glycosyltransferase family 4 protein n=1 Tax=Candidatus Corynebacterium gallistercoris TaxID=2838530 RepID=A0A9D1RUZ5_9CORY|nr:glycosyltransferase family 4 protein [Candidatus Corynebacterium gallistercoris]
MKIVLLCWRDTDHPEGGGSERYLERVADYLADQGHQVMFRTAKYPGAPRFEYRRLPSAGQSNGQSGTQSNAHGDTNQANPATVLFSRGGGNLSVYPRALAVLLAERLGIKRLGFGRFSYRLPLAYFGRPDVVVDTQNGVPFFASLVSGAPTIVLTHHCHREQWSVAGPLLSRLGWFIESRLSPLVHRRTPWVTVSAPSAEELTELGVPRDNIRIIRNGIDPVPSSLIPDAPNASTAAASSTGPNTPDTSTNPANAPGPPTVHLVALSRLVPHKQIEHALDALAAVRRTHPNVRLDIIGDGWWADKLREHARELGIESHVIFRGHVSEELKHRVLGRAALHVMPSRKEGWGLAVIEAAQHGVPTVGYESSAGLRDSVIDGETGLLCGSPGGLINAVEYLLDHPEERARMGQAAKERAAEFSWEATGAAWDAAVRELGE